MVCSHLHTQCSRDPPWTSSSFIVVFLERTQRCCRRMLIWVFTWLSLQQLPSIIFHIFRERTISAWQSREHPTPVCSYSPGLKDVSIVQLSLCFSVPSLWNRQQQLTWVGQCSEAWGEFLDACVWNKQSFALVVNDRVGYFKNSWNRNSLDFLTAVNKSNNRTVKRKKNLWYHLCQSQAVKIQSEWNDWIAYLPAYLCAYVNKARQTWC